MAIKTYYKQFVAWATNLRTKYNQDIFFRTECNVILFQIFFAISILIITTISFNYLYQNITGTLIDQVRMSLMNSRSIDGVAIMNSLETIKKDNLIGMFVLVIMVTILFGYFGARIALTPTKNALSSQKLFISNVAHELRSPLAIIKTNSEVALLNTPLDPLIEQSLLSNVEELNRTSEIINNLLSLTTLVRPGRLPFADLDFGVIVDTVVNQIKTLAQSKNLELILHKRHPSMVWGNAIALEQIVLNLVKNAINHTPPGGIVEVTVEPDYQGSVILTVKDTGVGIPKKDLFHIFEPFYKAEYSRTRRAESSGLGLTIVNEMIKIHSGKISIRSAEGKGTSAIAVFPFNKHAPTPNTNDQLDEISVEYVNKSNN